MALDQEALSLLKELTESFGPAGFEREPVRIVKRWMETYADEFLVDKLGSLVFKKTGIAERPHILLAGHVDEVGFVVTGLEKETGFLTFSPLGGWFDQVLLGQRVIVRTSERDLLGVIASKPPHILPPDEVDKVVKKERMFIDIGATSKKDAETMGVRIGDPVIPWSPFTTIRDGKMAVGKAFDDRIGVFLAMQVIRQLKQGNVKHPNTVFGAATVMEEVGLRGATTVPHLIDPDVGLVLEVDIAGDVPEIKPQEAPSRLGLGPTILTFDSSMIPNLALKKLVIETAEEHRIPYQLSFVAKGGTDGGHIHIHKIGCPSIVIGVPTRHIHSHASLLMLEDIENAARLTVELLKKLDSRTVQTLTAI